MAISAAHAMFVVFKLYMFQRFILITVAQKWTVAIHVGRRVRFSSSRAQAPYGMDPGSGRDDALCHGRAMQHDQANLGLAQQRSGRHFDGSQLVRDGTRTPGCILDVHVEVSARQQRRSAGL
jgi:hypothetical protein